MSNLLLTNEQIKEIRELQATLDERIRKEHGLEGADLSLEKHLALKTEFFEFVNEIESFKYWKKNKGKSKILEEACDALHFIMSIAIDNDVELELSDLINLDKYDKDSYDMNELLGIIDANILDVYISKEYEGLNGVLAMMCIALDKCEYNAGDLYNAYIEKNKENHARQDRNY